MVLWIRNTLFESKGNLFFAKYEEVFVVFLGCFCHAESKYFVYVADACKGQFGITKNVTCYLSTSFYRLPCSSVGHV